MCFETPVQQRKIYVYFMCFETPVQQMCSVLKNFMTP